MYTRNSGNGVIIAALKDFTDSLQIVNGGALKSCLQKGPQIALRRVTEVLSSAKRIAFECHHGQPLLPCGKSSVEALEYIFEGIDNLTPPDRLDQVAMASMGGQQ